VGTVDPGAVAIVVLLKAIANEAVASA
jgi:hypothetical protein